MFTQSILYIDFTAAFGLQLNFNFGGIIFYHGWHPFHLILVRFSTSTILSTLYFEIAVLNTWTCTAQNMFISILYDYEISLELKVNNVVLPLFGVYSVILELCSQ